MCVRCVSLVTGYCCARAALEVFRHHPLARNRVGESIPGGSHAHRVPDLQSVFPTPPPPRGGPVGGSPSGGFPTPMVSLPSGLFPPAPPPGPPPLARGRATIGDH